MIQLRQENEFLKQQCNELDTTQGIPLTPHPSHIQSPSGTPIFQTQNN